MFGIIVITSIIVFSFNIKEQRIRDVYDALRILTALLGNPLYFLKMNRTIKKLDNIREEEHIKYLEKNGRTNLKLAILIFIVLTALSILSFIL
jgi:hypothetical protein